VVLVVVGVSVPSNRLRTDVERRIAAPPDDDESAGAVERHAGQVLSLRGLGVDLELNARRQPVRREAPPLNAVGARVGPGAPLTLPENHEAAGAVGPRRVAELVAGRVGVHLEIGTLRDSLPIEAPQLKAVAARVGPEAAPALPLHDEASGAIGDDAWEGLVGVGVGVHLELIARGRPLGVEPLRLDTPAARVGAAAADAVPNGDEAVSERRDGRIELIPARVGIDLELAADRRTGRVEALPLDAAPAGVRSAAATDALPHHDEAARHRGHPWETLEARRVRVHLEVAAHGLPVRVEAPRLDAAVVRVRPRAAVAPPDHHESLRAVRDDGGKKLIPGRVGIHLELAPGRRARRIEATRPDAGAAGILRGGIRLPDHDEAVRAVRRDRRIALPSGREAVHQEFRTDGIARRGLCERPPPECEKKRDPGRQHAAHEGRS
jgi:hypothetical protein